MDDTAWGSFPIRLPAILIGGPPNSGKSHLTERLGVALQRRTVAHYVLRANPDGEGAWSYQLADSERAPLRSRARGIWSPDLAACLADDVARRHLPLLVDAGGVASDETARIAGSCTHALLLSRATSAPLEWSTLANRCNLHLLADLRSALDEPQAIIATMPTLRGTISGLRHGQSSDGPCFALLVERVAALFDVSGAALRTHHHRLASADLVLDINQPIFPLPAHTTPDSWHPDELPLLLASLPHARSLAIYGRGPAWLYAALACHEPQQPFALFDARLGWLSPPQVQIGTYPDDRQLRWCLVAHDGYDRLVLDIPGAYLDIRHAHTVALPAVPSDRGLILDGRLPNWLVCALARVYTATPWLALYQPQLTGAVVVRSSVRNPAVGQLLPLTT